MYMSEEFWVNIYDADISEKSDILRCNWGDLMLRLHLVLSLIILI